jgi:hypothetical protein
MSDSPKRKYKAGAAKERDIKLKILAKDGAN